MKLGLWNKRRGDWAILAIIVAFFLCFFWPAVFGGRFLIAGDSLVYSYPLRMAAWEMIRQGSLPLWTPFVFSGYPLLSMAQLGIGYPLTWGYLFLPGHWAEQIYILAPYLLSPIFTYAYLRQVGRSPLAALLGGLSFAYSGLVFSPIGLNGMLPNAAMWLPLILLAIERSRSRRFIPCLLLGAGAFAMSVLSGIGQGFVYAGALAIAYALFVTAFLPANRDGWLTWARWRPLAVCAGGMVLGAGVAAFQILETQHAAKRSVRAILSFDQFSEGGFPFTLAWKSWLDPLHHHGDVTTFVPFLATAFALVCIATAFRKQRERRIFFWLAVAAITWILMLGAHTPFYKLLYYFPVLNRFRMPSRHALEWTFALSMLASYGWDTAAAYLSRKQSLIAGRRLQIPLISATLVTVAVAIFAAVRWRAVSLPFSNQSSLIWGDLDAGYLQWKLIFTVLIFVAVVTALRIAAERWRFALAALVIAIACFVEPVILFIHWSLPSSATVDRFTRFAPPTNLMRQLPPEQNRVYSQINPFAESDTQAPHLDPANFTMLAGLHDVAGYEPLMLERYSRALNSRAWDLVNRTPALMPDMSLFQERSHVLDLLNTAYVTAYTGLSWMPGSLEEKHGIQFDPGNWGIDVGMELPTKLTAHVPEGDVLALVTTLGNAGHLVEGTPVARITVHTDDGRVIERELLAGRDTAELAHDHPDIRSAMRHSLPTIYDNMGSSESPDYRYLARINLDERVRVKQVEIVKLIREPGLGLWKASVFDSATTRSTPLLALDPDHWQPVQQQDGIIVLRNQRALPRAWLVTEAEAMDGTLIWKRIRGLDDKPFDPRRTVLMEIEPQKLPKLTGAPLSADSYARIATYEPNGLVIETNADQPTILVVSEMHFPGWVATVDGEKAPLHTADFILRGVALTAGTHRVEMSYRAPAARTGAIVSLLSLLLIVGLAGYAKRQRSG